MPSRYLVDTNVLLRAAHSAADGHLLCGTALHSLIQTSAALHFTMQNAAEFWNVSTRPALRNGFGLPLRATHIAWIEIEQNLTLLPDDAEVYRIWRTLVQAHQIRGAQVHDDRLAAAMLVHNVPHILTLNTADFARFPGVQALHPQEV